MSLITRMRKQNAVYWPFSSTDNFGDKVAGDPIQIIVRWEDIVEEFLDTNSERQLSRSKVYVGIDMALGGILMQGTLDDITDEENPKENTGAWEIRRFEKLPTIRATEFLRTAIL